MYFVVDDDRDVVVAMQKVLTDEGHCVTSASSPTEALVRLDALGAVACVVLLDLVMPGDPCGAALVDAIRDRNPRARVIVTSALRGDGPFPGVVAMLGKPFALDQLLALVARHERE